MKTSLLKVLAMLLVGSSSVVHAQTSQVFDKAYNFAVDAKGPNLPHPESERLAGWISQLPDSQEILDVYVDAFRFSFSDEDGIKNESRSESLGFARTVINQPFAREKLTCFKTTYSTYVKNGAPRIPSVIRNAGQKCGIEIAPRRWHY